MRWGELVIFTTLAAGLHAAAWAMWQDSGAARAPGGAAGQDTLTLQAAPEQLAALVDRWEQTPETSAAPTAPVAPPPVSAAAPPPLAERAAPALALPQTTLAPDAQTALPARPEVEPLKAEALTQAPQLAALAPEQPAAQMPRLDAPPARTPPLPRPADPARPALPQLDTQPAAASTIAPTASLRPESRPALPPKAAPARQAPKATPSAPAPAQQAAGSGAARSSGTTARAKPAAAKPSAGRLRQLEAQWGAAIQAKVQRNARSSGSGPTRVTLAVNVARSGKLLGVRVIRPSGMARADKAAVSAVKRARRFKAAPKALTDRAYTFQVTIRAE